MLGARLRPERDGGSEPFTFAPCGSNIPSASNPSRTTGKDRTPVTLPRLRSGAALPGGRLRLVWRAFFVCPLHATGWGSDKPPGVSWDTLTTRAEHRVGRVTLEGGARAGRRRSRQGRPCVGPGLVPTCPLRRMAPPEVGLGREPTGVTLAQPLRIHRQRFR